MPEPAPASRRGLGRGLEVLLGGASSAELAHLPVDSIQPNPRQPRRRFDSESTSGLAESIRAQGVVQPVLVRPRAEGGWELIAGERRWRAAREAGVATVPAVVRQADDRDSLLLALVENVAREQLSPVEEARAYAALVDEFALSLGDVAERVGRSKPSVSNRLRLLELPDDVLGMVERGELSEGHARAVLAVPDQEGRRRLARQIVRGGLSVRAAERQRDGPEQNRRREAARGRSTRLSPPAPVTRCDVSPASSHTYAAPRSRSTSRTSTASQSSSRRWKPRPARVHDLVPAAAARTSAAWPASASDILTPRSRSGLPIAARVQPRISQRVKSAPASAACVGSQPVNITEARLALVEVDLLQAAGVEADVLRLRETQPGQVDAAVDEDDVDEGSR